MESIFFSFSDVGGMIPSFSALAMNSGGKQLWIWCMKYVVSLEKFQEYGRNWKTRIC
jgi:hypothetical protein